MRNKRKPFLTSYYIVPLFYRSCFQDFGYVSLTLNPTYPEDLGTYTCLLTNRFGQAQSSAGLTCIGVEAMLLDTQHADSLQRIGYLEDNRFVFWILISEIYVLWNIPYKAPLFAPYSLAFFLLSSRDENTLSAWRFHIVSPCNIK